MKNANGCGSIRKKTVTRNGKDYSYWEARVTTGYDLTTGKQKIKSITGKTQKEVREKLQTLTVEINSGEYQEPSKMTVSEWLHLWLDTYCNDIKYATKKSYTGQTNAHIIPVLGNIKLQQLNPPQIQAFLNNLAVDGYKGTSGVKNGVRTEKKPLSAKTIKNISGILTVSLNKAVEIGYLKSNPATKTTLPRVVKTEIEPLTADQIKEFLKLLDDEELKAVYLVIMFTGLREAEAIGLTWDCVDFENGILTIGKQLQKRPEKDGGYTFSSSKNGKVRRIKVAPFVIKVLKEEKLKQGNNYFKCMPYGLWNGFKTLEEQKTSLVFTKDNGEHLTADRVYAHYKRIAKQIGAPNSRVHDLRHTYAVLSLQNGDDVKTLQHNLGHATASFTLDVYGHASDAMQKASADRMQGFIENIV